MSSTDVSQESAQISVVETSKQLNLKIDEYKEQELKIGFVPTMGNLHEGHLSLVDRARELCDRVVVSLFVNPTQFGVNEDFDSYPRTRQADVEKLERHDADIVFTPDIDDIYPRETVARDILNEPELTGILEGEFRPGFFHGVCTVVDKLFRIVRPDIAVFGQKDYQQLLVIKKMVDKQHLPIEIVAEGTKREESGLAMSSRNAYLSDDERVIASTLSKTLNQIVRSIESGGRPDDAEAVGKSALIAKGFEVDYLTIRRAEDIGEPCQEDTRLVVLAAAKLGKTRLIDNMIISREI